MGQERIVQPQIFDSYVVFLSSESLSANKISTNTVVASALSATYHFGSYFGTLSAISNELLQTVLTSSKAVFEGVYYGDGRSLLGAIQPDQPIINSVMQNTSGAWNSVYTSYSNTSSNFLTIQNANATFLNLTGGTISKDLTITGNLSVMGTMTYLDTNVSTTSAMVIDTNSTIDALRITQRGSGNVLLVEDDTNPDSTAFVITSSGNVGIGVNAPDVKLAISGSVQEGQGTRAVGVASHAEGLSSIALGTGTHAAGFRSTAAQDYTYTWSDGNNGTSTVNVSSTRSGQYMVSASGGVYIPGKVGIGTDSLANALTVNGTISSNNTITVLGGNSTQWNDVYNNYQSFAPTVATLLNVSTNYLTITGGTVSNTLAVSGNFINEGVLWYSVSATENATWRSVTYGNGIFVAVNNDGVNRVMTSPDGVNWTPRTAAEVTSWDSVTYGNGIFVAVSIASGKVMTSVDGITWVTRATPAASNWHSVIYGNGLFVAIANSGTDRVMTSPDGVNWTARTASEANSWTSIAYGTGRFVAVASSGTNRVMTSIDGITWTPVAATEANSWNSVTYGNGLFVAVASTGTNMVMTSPDGITWTPRSASENILWTGVTYGNGLFVAVALNVNRVMTSSNGINWVSRPIPETSLWRAVTYGNGVFVAVAQSARLMVSGKQKVNNETISNIRQGGLTLYGNLTTSEVIFASGGNSNEWNIAYTFVETNSAISNKWNAAYSFVEKNSSIAVDYNTLSSTQAFSYYFGVPLFAQENSVDITTNTLANSATIHGVFYGDGTRLKGAIEVDQPVINTFVRANTSIATGYDTLSSRYIYGGFIGTSLFVAQSANEILTNTALGSATIHGKFYGDGTNLTGVTVGNRRFEFIPSVGPANAYSYSGTTRLHTTTSSMPYWKIVRLEYASDGTVASLSAAVNVAWTDRTTVTYV